jgi:hypothetical protein
MRQQTKQKCCYNSFGLNMKPEISLPSLASMVVTVYEALGSSAILRPLLPSSLDVDETAGLYVLGLNDDMANILIDDDDKTIKVMNTQDVIRFDEMKSCGKRLMEIVERCVRDANIPMTPRTIAVLDNYIAAAGIAEPNCFDAKQ